MFANSNKRIVRPTYIKVPLSHRLSVSLIPISSSRSPSVTHPRHNRAICSAFVYSNAQRSWFALYLPFPGVSLADGAVFFWQMSTSSPTSPSGTFGDGVMLAWFLGTKLLACRKVVHDYFRALALLPFGCAGGVVAGCASNSYCSTYVRSRLRWKRILRYLLSKNNWIVRKTRDISQSDIRYQSPMTTMYNHVH